MAFNPTRHSPHFLSSLAKGKLANFVLSSPEEDSFLEVQFGFRSFTKRRENKKNLANILGFDKNLPLLVVVTEFFDDVAVLDSILMGLKDLDVQVLLLAPKACNVAIPGAHYCLQELNQKSLHQALASGDMILLPTNCTLEIGDACHRYGIVPIASVDLASMRDYDPAMEAGNAFLYKANSVPSIFATIGRALETFKLSYDWQRIQKNGMEK